METPERRDIWPQTLDKKQQELLERETSHSEVKPKPSVCHTRCSSDLSSWREAVRTPRSHRNLHENEITRPDSSQATHLYTRCLHGSSSCLQNHHQSWRGWRTLLDLSQDIRCTREWMLLLTILGLDMQPRPWSHSSSSVTSLPNQEYLPLSFFWNIYQIKVL